MLRKLLEKGLVTETELELIQEHENVEACTYEGLENGHDGDYLYHVKINGNQEIYSITTR